MSRGGSTEPSSGRLKILPFSGSSAQASRRMQPRIQGGGTARLVIVGPGQEDSAGRMTIPFYWVDAFADRPFAGNPAAVCPLEAWPDDALLQRMARQHGLSETAFIVPTGPARFHLRWFTPAVEVDLCGHATLATAHVLFNERGLVVPAITFDSRSGPLIVRRAEEDRLELNFPSAPPEVEPDLPLVQALEATLQVKPAWVGRNRFDKLVLLTDPAAVRALRPDFGRLAEIRSRGVIVTAPGDDGCDFISRFFAPQSGIPEDPVTGSAHCALVPFWAERLGRTRLHARQVSARGGELWCRLEGDRVTIAGRSVTYLQGTVTLV